MTKVQIVFRADLEVFDSIDHLLWSHSDGYEGGTHHYEKLVTLYFKSLSYVPNSLLRYLVRDDAPDDNSENEQFIKDLDLYLKEVIES